MSVKKERVSSDRVNKIFGGRLAKARRAKNLTQSDLGKLVELSRGSISNLESGAQNVMLHQVFSLAYTLNVPVDELIPLLRDVVLHDGGADSDRLFLLMSKRQLVESDASEGDDDNT
jgi:transcriptional regulator with XRE-family HTH domain